MEKLILSLLISLLLACSADAAKKAIPPPLPTKPDMLIGAFYFPGWSKTESWYCIAANPRVQHPLLGYYREGDPDAADWHIKWALEHGVSFFAFDYYTAGGGQMLETALDEGFLKSRYISQFKFCINWCNHAETSTMTAEEMDRFGELALRKYLKHPSYLKIDGKPVVMILVGNGFVKNLGVDRAREAFAGFRDKCRKAGLPGVYLVFCEGEIRGEQDIKNSFAAGADAFCLYNYPYAGTDCTGPGKCAEASYSHLIEQGEILWKHWKGITDGRFWPTVMPGWDRRPWTKNNDLVRTGSTPELFADSLKRSRKYVNSDKIVMIEAWNEWGEGSVLEPSVEHKFAYLDKVRDTFCKGAGAHKDMDPKAIGTRRPVFDLHLPSIDTWRFDRNAEGWIGSGISNLEANWGVLTFTTTSTDPQITSPAAYLECSKYSRAHIRMRASSATANSKSATGQLFWSTIDSIMSGETSVTFTVPLDDQWHDYDLKLDGIPAWKGMADQFRLDPVDAAGVTVYVDEIQLSGREVK